MTTNKHARENILAIDVEDWYHPEYVKEKAPRNREERISISLRMVLDLLDEYDVHATFFLVGELAEKHPEMMDKIAANGDEIAFHGYYHDPLWNLTRKQFRDELLKFNSLIRSATGDVPLGYRAPTYSMDSRTAWALDILEEEGYLYDASVFPTNAFLYGVPSAPMIPYHPSSKNITTLDPRRRLIEFPALVYPLMSIRIPAAGGFYLRLLPVFILKEAVRKMNEQGFPAVFSFHPWEIDPNTPRLDLGGARSFITYYNLRATSKKLRHMLRSFKFTDFRDYIKKNIFT